MFYIPHLLYGLMKNDQELALHLSSEAEHDRVWPVYRKAANKKINLKAYCTWSSMCYISVSPVSENNVAIPRFVIKMQLISFKSDSLTRNVCVPVYV